MMQQAIHRYCDAYYRVLEQGIEEMRRIFGPYAMHCVIHQGMADGLDVNVYIIKLPAYFHLEKAEALLRRFDEEWFLPHCDSLPGALFDYEIRATEDDFPRNTRCTPETYWDTALF